MGAFVLSSHAVVNEAIADELAQSDSDRAFLVGQAGRGSSMIVDPDRTVLAGSPDGPWEGIVSADVDLEDCVVARHIHDFAGHYNRPDIFRPGGRPACRPARADARWGSAGESRARHEASPRTGSAR